MRMTFSPEALLTSRALLYAGMLYDPRRVLDHLGIPVVHTWLRDTWGAWSPSRSTVVVASGLSATQERCVLAHELEHVLAEHQDCNGGPVAVYQERQADIEAARKLVAISDLCEIAQYADDVRVAAHELNVTERMLRIRLTDLDGEGWPWPAGSKTGG
jgi:Zn-dependent peptidase ImmA (M78 family)